MIHCHLLPFVIVIIFLTFILSYDGARILGVFPTPSISHQVVFRTLTQELARRGHHLVIVTPDPVAPEGELQNIREIDVHNISYNYIRLKGREIKTKKVTNKLRERTFRVLNNIFYLQLQTRQVQELINGYEKFDLVLTEALIRPALVMSYRFQAPVIQISSFGGVPPNLQTIGALTHPLFFPEHTRTRVYNLTLFEKIYSVYDDMELRHMRGRLEESENKMIKKYFGPDAPTVSKLVESVDMIFLNVDPIWEDNRPVPPGVIYLGRLHQMMTPKDLPKDLKSFLDNSNYGVIYVSFGTNVHVSKIPPEAMQAFTKVFSKLPYDILWKWDNDEMPGKPENVRISKWLPQSDLLRHPKLKLFITQGGLQSTDEAICSGVPLIAIPMISDQWYNAEKIARHGIGIQLNMESVTEESLNESINYVIRNGREFRSNIKRLDNLMRDRPDTPLERAVWWTEYVIRHRGAKHLRSAAADVTWTEYLMLDVVISVAVLGLLVFIAAVLLIRCSYFALFRRRRLVKSKNR